MSGLVINTDDFFSRSTWRAVLAEGIATALFVFLGAGVVVVSGTFLAEGLGAPRLLAIALAHGLGISVLVAATAHISGGHLNPAVTVGVMVVRKITVMKGALYIISQLAGAVAGAIVLKAVIPAALEGTLGAHRLGMGVSVWEGLLTEVVLTFVLVLVVFATAMDPRGPRHLAPVAIGFAVLVDHLLGLPITGASMNPARSYGPALVARAWDHYWIYWIGPLVGALLAALAYEFLFGRSEEERRNLGKGEFFSIPG